MSTESNPSQHDQSAGQPDRCTSLTNSQEGAAQRASSTDWDETVQAADAERDERKPDQSQGGNSEQSNNGRGGGK